MPTFGKTSKERLATCEPALQDLFEFAVKRVDCKILEGHRGRTRQDTLHDMGLSKKEYPNSKHNSMPSRAADVSPYPVRYPKEPDWKHEKYALSKWTAEDLREYVKAYGRFYMFAGYMRGLGDAFKTPVRCGADWDGDFELTDQTFDDLQHFELAEEKP